MLDETGMEDNHRFTMPVGSAANAGLPLSHRGCSCFKPIELNLSCWNCQRPGTLEERLERMAESTGSVKSRIIRDALLQRSLTGESPDLGQAQWSADLSPRRRSRRALDLADGSLLIAAEELGISDILTIDSDYSIYRTANGRALRNVLRT
ncbi:MAG: hypothetical protein NT005_01780 [Spirochaetes bacterium]|nr:hypothetical protein [Spirochaetota bacterium]